MLSWNKTWSEKTVGQLNNAFNVQKSEEKNEQKEIGQVELQS